MNLIKRAGAKMAVDDISLLAERAPHEPQIGSAMNAMAERPARTAWFWPIGPCINFNYPR